MGTFSLGTLILTPVDNNLPKEEILARYDNLYVLFTNKKDGELIGPINIGKPFEVNNNPILSNCWGINNYNVVKYFTPVKDGENTNPIFSIESTGSMTVAKSTTLSGKVSLEDYLSGTYTMKNNNRISISKTIVPITKEEKAIYDEQNWETITFKCTDKSIVVTDNDKEPNSCFFGVIGEERINLFKTKDSERPIIRVYFTNDRLVAANALWNAKSLRSVVTGRYGFNKVEEVDNVKKIG